MKKWLLFILLILPGKFLFSQSTDSLKFHRILLISFNPDYYLSDAEQDLMRQNKRSPDDYRTYLRRSLDNKIAGQLERTIPCYSLLSDTSKYAIETGWDFYNHSALKYTKPYGVKVNGDNSKQKKSKSSDTNLHSAAAYDLQHADIQVMDNSVTDTSWLRKIAGHYESDILLSINQFEIKTNYNSCMDISKGIYRREVHVHYTLMTASGKRLTGNIAIAAFASNENRVEDISEKVFPLVAQDIATLVNTHLK
jgi:hypothetical protein